MIYNIDLKGTAQLDLFRLAKSEPKAFKKAQKLIEELKVHPRTGTGHPEQLKGDRAGAAVSPTNIASYTKYTTQK